MHKCHTQSMSEKNTNAIAGNPRSHDDRSRRNRKYSTISPAQGLTSTFILQSQHMKKIPSEFIDGKKRFDAQLIGRYIQRSTKAGNH